MQSMKPLLHRCWPNGAAGWRLRNRIIIRSRPCAARRLVDGGDCIACHTAPGGKPFAGGRPIETPFGGIFAQHHARPRHRHRRLVRRTIFARDARGTAAGRQAIFIRRFHTRITPRWRATTSTRSMTICGRWRRSPTSSIAGRCRFRSTSAPRCGDGTHLYFTPGDFAPIPKASEEFNRGAYLVEGLGHCGACHTPLNAFGANKADQYLQGNPIDNWIAPNITNDARAGLGNWSTDDVVQYLKTGQTRSSPSPAGR